MTDLKKEMTARFHRWAREYAEKEIEKGIEQGIEKGIHIANAESLQKLLRHRFGPLSTHILAKLDAASTAQLEAWQDRALEAQCLDDVFRP
ncbi:hypothetical protein J5T34_20745 [Cupriavidus gilardii]|uniref:hypothetical protein n=1 Tax=Cupriavidus gilardii TaxID=82541 RepID=UPI001ABE3348|nr:hypothetical protein [Cupriavidus gilardii]MBO4123160.1 hypothetical protein [Cupriavidus gilardii]